MSARYPGALSRVDQVEPVPRRIRAQLAGRTVLDTTRALYHWEWPYYPRYLVPAADVDPAALVEEGTSRTDRGTVTERGVHPDLAWSYDLPTRQLSPVAGLVAFLDEAVDVSIDGVAQPRPVTHFAS